MSNVITLAGTPFVDFRNICEGVAKRDDVDHVVIVVQRKDGFLEIFHDSQPINGVVMSASVLNLVANDLARGTIDKDA